MKQALVSDQLSTNKDQLKLEYMSLLDERRDMLDLVEQLNQEISTQHKGQEDLHMQVMEHRDKERQSQRALQQAINDKIVLENKIKVNYFLSNFSIKSYIKVCVLRCRVNLDNLFSCIYIFRCF